MIWNERHESMPIAERQELQLERLKHTLDYAYRNVRFYAESFDREGVKPSDLKRLSDLSKFPTTSKSDLRDNYPFGLFAKPLEEIQRMIQAAQSQ